VLAAPPVEPDTTSGDKLSLQRQGLQANVYSIPVSLFFIFYYYYFIILLIII
jgi:hypothetical protein